MAAPKKLTVGNRKQTGECYHGKRRGRPLYCYEVIKSGAVVGWVEQHEIMTSRMAGRLRVADFYPLAWSWRAASDGPPPGRTYACHNTRQDAMESLLRHLDETSSDSGPRKAKP